MEATKTASVKYSSVSQTVLQDTRGPQRGSKSSTPKNCLIANGILQYYHFHTNTVNFTLLLFNFFKSHQDFTETNFFVSV